MGASTGGFTQVLLHHGADHVVALDVGHGQLVPELAEDPRVEDRSRTTVRGLAAEDLGGPVDLLVADLSFISLTLVLPTFRGLLRDEGDAVVLVKPQFEVGPHPAGQGRHRACPGRPGLGHHRGGALPRSTPGCTRARWRASPILGGEGNAEYLLWLTPRAEESMGWEAVVRTADEVSAP